MSLRVITSLNWLFGTLAIGLAFLLPVGLRMLSSSSERGALEAQVQDIVDAEKRHLQKRERYLLFNNTAPDITRAAKQLGVNIPTTDFVFDAFSDGTNALVIRAFIAPAALTAGSRPPMLYRYRIPYEGEPAGEWVTLSGRTPGLHGLPSTFAAMF